MHPLGSNHNSNHDPYNEKNGHHYCALLSVCDERFVKYTTVPNQGLLMLGSDQDPIENSLLTIFSKHTLLNQNRQLDLDRSHPLKYIYLDLTISLCLTNCISSIKLHYLLSRNKFERSSMVSNDLPTVVCITNRPTVGT